MVLDMSSKIGLITSGRHRSRIRVRRAHRAGPRHSQTGVTESKNLFTIKTLFMACSVWCSET